MKARVLWGLLVAGVLFVALSTASGVLYRLAFALLAVPVVGYLAVALGAGRIEGSVRRLTPYLQVGMDLEEQVAVRNLHWWPKLLLEVEHKSEPFGTGGRILSLWPFRTVRWTTRKHCERRGIYRFGELEIASRDPLGLFHRRVHAGSPQSVLVYPATVELPGFFVPSGRGWTEGLVKGRTFTPSAVASAVRPYVPGDSVGHIHWPLSRKTGTLMVKEFEREPSGPADAVWVLLDLHSSVQGGEGVESTVEYGVTIAASVAKRFLDSGRSVGLVINGEERIAVKPGTGLAQAGRILQALALAQPGEAGRVTDRASTVAANLSRGASVVMVTPSPLDEVTTAALTLDASGAAVVPILLEAGTFRGAGRSSGQQVRIPGTAIESYVIHQGDEIEVRLDHRLHGQMAMMGVSR